MHVDFNLSFRGAHHQAGFLLLSLLLVSAVPAASQPDPAQVAAILAEEIVSPQVSLF